MTAKSSAERVADYRARRKAFGEPDVTRKNRKSERKAYRARLRARASSRPFVGCDGEGCGVDALGRQHYMLLRMGERELFTGEPLTSYQCLDFICDQPPGSILVGFAFGYDVTMILRDLPEAQQRRLFEPKTFGMGHSPYVWFKDFDIDYLPKQYLKVRRVEIVRHPDGSVRRVGIKGSQRIIYETFGFFQKSFSKVIKEFNVGTEAERDRIDKNKAARSSFEVIDQEVRDYCALECVFLSELMNKLRGYCHDANIRPRSWNGAGKLAGALHKLNDTPTRDEVELLVPEAARDMANMAYYGGRFEITRTGSIKDAVYEYDIKSAYPAAMLDLPCLRHGAWHKASAKALRDHNGLYVSGVQFRTDPAPDMAGQLGAFPVRSKEGHLFWPLRGRGVYWSPEIESAKRRGAHVRLTGGYKFEARCDCQPFKWVDELFEYRKSIGSSGPGYPIKLGINSLYGLLAQRKGNGRYANLVWAGLITAITRATLNDAIALNPDRTIMIATDAVYSLDPLPLPIGDKLGQWDAAQMDGLFIVQPGLYWCPAKRKRKSRGLSGKFFEEPGRTESFEDAWRSWESLERHALPSPFPAVNVPVPSFVGLKLAISRNRPLTAGCWISDTRSISFDYRNKRSNRRWTGGHIITEPKIGASDLVSLPHREFLSGGGAEPWEAARAMLDEQPDYVDLGVPWKD